MHEIIQPSKEEILERISTINNINLKDSSIEEINELLSLLFTGYKINTPVFHKGFELYRGIKYKSKPRLLSKLSYPPKDKASVNRASREGEQMFYCSNSESVPCFELDVKAGDKLIVGKWITTKKLMVNNVGYSDSNFINLKSERNNQNWQAGIGLKEVKSIDGLHKTIRDYLAKQFSQFIPEDDLDMYKLTIAIAEKHLMGGLFDGLLYPTIPMKANADNLALKKSFIDSGGIDFFEVYFIEVIKVGDFKYDIKRLDWANSVSAKNEIEWRGRLPQWQLKNKGDELKMIVENGKWVAYDANGNKIEPK